jgi:hypothetical protein
MIIVKTKNGDRFINEKAVTMVDHDRENAKVNGYGEKGHLFEINDVESIIYTNDAQPTEWKDEGSEIQRLKAELEKEEKKYNQLCEHSSYVREWFTIYEDAIISIKEQQKQAERENKGIYVSPLAIIEAAEKKRKESEEKFEAARKKWEK